MEMTATLFLCTVGAARAVNQLKIGVEETKQLLCGDKLIACV